MGLLLHCLWFLFLSSAPHLLRAAAPSRSPSSSTDPWSLLLLPRSTCRFPFFGSKFPLFHQGYISPLLGWSACTQSLATRVWCEICSWHLEDGVHSKSCFRRLNSYWTLRSSILLVDIIPDGGLVCEDCVVGFWRKVGGNQMRRSTLRCSFSSGRQSGTGIWLFIHLWRASHLVRILTRNRGGWDERRCYNKWLYMDDLIFSLIFQKL